jgi:glycosyltransferase involved in cell wall biosynthesis
MPEPTTVLIPALNEEASICKVLAEIPRPYCHQIIVVDNGSEDATGRVSREAGAEVVFEPRRGYGFACLAGLARLRSDTAVVAFLDADHSDYPSDLPDLTSPIYGGACDLVLGSRALIAENRAYLPLHQRWGNEAVLILLRALYGRRFTDLGPFRAIRVPSLRRLNMADTTWGWNVEMQIKAVQNGLRIREVPVRYRERIGRSKISGTVRGSLAAGFKILYALVRYSFWRRSVT